MGWRSLQGPAGTQRRQALPGGATKGVQERVGWSGALMCRQTGGGSCGATVFWKLNTGNGGDQAGEESRCRQPWPVSGSEGSL